MKIMISRLQLAVLAIVVIVATVGISCTENTTDSANLADLDAVARDYLFLELSMGLHDAAHVDAYFGPDEIKSLADTSQLSLTDIEQKASLMRDELRVRDSDARTRGLIARLDALLTRIALNNGETLPFDEEAKRLADEIGRMRDEVRRVLKEDGPALREKLVRYITESGNRIDWRILKTFEWWCLCNAFYIAVPCFRSGWADADGHERMGCGSRLQRCLQCFTERICCAYLMIGR